MTRRSVCRVGRIGKGKEKHHDSGDGGLGHVWRVLYLEIRCPSLPPPCPVSGKARQGKDPPTAHEPQPKHQSNEMEMKMEIPTLTFLSFNLPRQVSREKSQTIPLYVSSTIHPFSIAKSLYRHRDCGTHESYVVSHKLRTSRSNMSLN